MQSDKEKILIFGGTIFLGKAFLKCLENSDVVYQIHCLNRGTPYWNNSVRKDHPEVIHHFCDRNDPHNTRQVLKDLNKKQGISEVSKWKAVIDFTVFEQIHQESLKELQGLAQKYIMISTDSVYNNSNQLKLPVKEADFNLQAELNKLQKDSNIVDDYGYKKLKCEVNLYKMELNPYICLRLPDVIGEFDVDDNSQRFWCSLTWIKDSQKHPIPMTPTFKQKKLSFVDSYDLANTLHWLVRSEKIPPHKAYNLCANQTLSLFEFYQIIAEVVQTNAVYYESKEYVDYFYPSVQFGTIDCSLAKQQIGWKPTLIGNSIRRIARFYIQSGLTYPSQHQKMTEQLSNYLSKLQLKH